MSQTWESAFTRLLIAIHDWFFIVAINNRLKNVFFILEFKYINHVCILFFSSLIPINRTLGNSFLSVAFIYWCKTLTIKTLASLPNPLLDLIQPWQQRSIFIWPLQVKRLPQLSFLFRNKKLQFHFSINFPIAFLVKIDGEMQVFPAAAADFCLSALGNFFGILFTVVNPLPEFLIYFWHCPWLPKRNKWQ